MTDAEMNAIYRANLGLGHIEALRGVWTAGYYQGAGLTPSTSIKQPAKSTEVAAPVAVIKIHR